MGNGQQPSSSSIPEQSLAPPYVADRPAGLGAFGNLSPSGGDKPTPLSGRSQVALILVALTTAVSALIMVLRLYLMVAFGRSDDVYDIGDDVFAIYDLASYLVLAEVALLVSAGISVMVLFHRMMKNGEHINSRRVRYRAFWAYLGWLIPFLNLFRPVQVVNQIWDTSAAKMPAVREDLPVTGRIWWLLLLGSVYLAGLGPRSDWTREVTMWDLNNEAFWLWLGELVFLAAGVAFLVLLNQMVRRQETALAADTPAGSSAV